MSVCETPMFGEQEAVSTGSFSLSLLVLESSRVKTDRYIEEKVSHKFAYTCRAGERRGTDSRILEERRMRRWEDEFRTVFVWKEGKKDGDD